MNHEDSVVQMQPLLETRIVIYDLMRRSFLEEPTQEFLSFLKAANVFRNFPFLEESLEIHDGVALVNSFMQENDLTSAEFYDSLHWDYTRMFIGPNRLPAPLWESAYLNKDKLLFQEQTLKVRQAYLKYQLRPKHFMQEADDHLGLELDFMYQLSQQALQALENQDNEKLCELLLDQNQFLQEHLLKWVPNLTQKIVESASLGFYPGLAKILKGYLELDLEALNELLDIKNQVC